MKQLSPEARRLLQLARHEDEPEAQALLRVERLLAGRLASGVGVAATSTLWSQTASGVLMGPAKFVVAAVVVGAASVATVRGLNGSNTPPARNATVAAGVKEVRVAAPVPSASSNALVAVPPTPTRSSNENRTAARQATVASGGPVEAESPDRLRQETRMLRAAQQALRSGDAAGALSLLEQQDHAFQSGQLQEERSAARVLALCQMGRLTEARSEALRFERRWPTSALLAKVRSSCF
jgi:hypothetical protein